MPGDPTHFDLWGRPHETDADLELDLPPVQLSEATIVADPPLLRRLAEFFTYTADELEKHGSDFGHEHFCYFAKVPEEQRTWADIIISRRFV